ncbi:MAG: methylated-DNA--[protein]-cysteine S-methyltransferase [Pirellulales bacterium]
MSPRSFRERGAGETIRYVVKSCDLGYVLAAATERGVCAIALGDDAQSLILALRRDFSAARLIADDPAFEKTAAVIVRLVQSPESACRLPLDVRGTAFQHRVWDALRNIPKGNTVTYAQLAQSLGIPRAVRAVATACASNRLAVAIPCHRVVRTDGSLAGYRWGVERKAALLERERGETVSDKKKSRRR